MHTSDIAPTNYIEIELQGCILVIIDPDRSQCSQFSTLSWCRDILDNGLKGNRVGGVFGSDSILVIGYRRLRRKMFSE